VFKGGGESIVKSNCSNAGIIVAGFELEFSVTVAASGDESSNGNTRIMHDDITNSMLKFF